MRYYVETYVDALPLGPVHHFHDVFGSMGRRAVFRHQVGKLKTRPGKSGRGERFANAHFVVPVAVTNMGGIHAVVFSGHLGNRHQFVQIGVKARMIFKAGTDADCTLLQRIPGLSGHYREVAFFGGTRLCSDNFRSDRVVPDIGCDVQTRLKSLQDIQIVIEASPTFRRL